MLHHGDQFLHRGLVDAGERDEQVERGLAVPGLQARERGSADAGEGGHLIQRQPGLLAQYPQPGADRRKQLRYLMALGDHRDGCHDWQSRSLHILVDRGSRRRGAAVQLVSVRCNQTDFQSRYW